MTDRTNKADRAPKPRPATIAGLMWLVLVVAVGLWLLRPSRTTTSPIVLLVGLVIVIPWIKAIAVLRRHWTTADPHYVPFHPLFDEAPKQVAGSIAAIVPEMEALGFQNRGHFQITRSVSNGDIYVTLFDNRRQRQYAKLWTTVIWAGESRRAGETVLAFFTEFTDGTPLVTSNSRTRPLTPRIRVHTGSMSVPWVRDPDQLHEIHDACVAHFGSGAIRLETPIEDAAEFLRNSQLKETAKFAESGYYNLDDDSKVYRPTWKGAILMSAKLLWPTKPIRAMLARRRSDAILRELGMEEQSART